MATKNPDIARFKTNLADERDSAALYLALAEAEADPVRADLFRQLAQSETEHADLWRDRLAALGIAEPRHRPSLRSRMLIFLARRMGVGAVLPTIAAAEVADQNKYAGQADAADLMNAERSHAAIVNATLGASGKGGGVSGAEIARAEKWHRGAAGNALRASVLGANDGLVSNFCLIMGVAGAGLTNRSILLTGLAGLISGACSMALGEWLSVTNARELATNQMAREAQEIAETPEAEARELALIYQAKGMTRESAQAAAAQIMQDKDKALDTLAREELGIDPDELGGNPWTAAGASFGLFALGAVFPIAPYLFTSGTLAVLLSAALAVLALAAIGVVTCLFNGRTPLFSATRQVVIGCAAAAVTYGAGHLMGVAVS
eukprot:gene8034-8111_t